MPAESMFLQALQGASFSFTRRPEPIAGDLRLSWGMAIVLLSLQNSHGKKCSFVKLHFLAHSIRSEASRELVMSALRGERHASNIQVRVEPWLNRAVALAHGLKLVTVGKGKSVALTEAGKEVAAAIDADRSLLAEERAFLASVGQRLTESVLSRIWRMEELI